MNSSLETYHGNVRWNVIPFVPKSGGTLLDVGGGYGGTARKLRELGHADKVGLIDMVPGEGMDFTYTGDIERSDVLETALAEHGPFQTILTLDVLEHLVDPWNVVGRLHKLLAPGGTMVASIPNVRHYTALAPLLLKNKWEYRDSGILDRTHLRFFVRSSAIELMTSSGLVLDGVFPIRNDNGKARLLRRASLGVLAPFTDFQYVVRVKAPI